MLHTIYGADLGRSPTPLTARKGLLRRPDWLAPPGASHPFLAREHSRQFLHDSRPRRFTDFPIFNLPHKHGNILKEE